MRLENNIRKKVLLLLVLVFAILVFSSFASATKVLHIGDSHSTGSYGKGLHGLLENSFGKGNVQTAAVCGARAVHFIKGLGSKCGTWFNDGVISTTSKSYFKISNLMSSFNPDIVVVSLGTNFHDQAGGVAGDMTNIASLRDTIKGKTCFWVGAPTSTASFINPTKINSELNVLVGNHCTFIDPTAYTADKSKLGTKGIHFTDTTNWESMVHTIVLAGSGSITKGTPSSTGTSGGGPSKPSAPAPISPTANIAGCSSLTTCKEVDDVWSKLTLTLSSFSSWKNKVWDPNKGMFRTYNEYYGLSAPSTPTSTKATVVSTPQIDAYIKEAAKVFVIDAALIKAIMKHESSFNQHAVSSTGCKGLMQVCSWSSYSSVITKYNLNNNVYDAKSNIYVGTSIYASKLKNIKGSCKSGDDELKCVIAAYNSGEGTINGVAAAVGKPASWNDIIAKLQGESYIKSSLPKSYYTSTFDTFVNCGSLGKVTRRRCKFNNLNGYVLKIFNDYQSFKGTI